MKNLICLSSAALLTAFFASCAVSTPDSRINARPAAFEKLSEKQKNLVSRGEIAEGMTKEAVTLAWGTPSRAVEGLRKGKSMERWDYQGTRPVVTNHFFGGYRTGFFGEYRYCGVGGGFGPTVAYVPYRKSSVWFVDGRVDEWERTK